MPTKVPHTLDAPQAESPEHAIRLLLEHAQPVATERVALDHAHGRVLAEQIRADRASPAADVSAMDG
ncbi:MAG: molybdopterin molybdenumtransferase MoeA, partial [Planctomycetes bacterium]|nr:molybdopterin molybdenumtransferase MoeA [Planctomycetota bacterium]